MAGPLAGFMFGLGIALAYAPPMAVAMKWFPRKKGLVNGIIVGGFGLGAFIFNTVQTTYLNPHNLSPDGNGYFTLKQNDVLERVPSVFLLLGKLMSMSISVLLSVRCPNNCRLDIHGDAAGGHPTHLLSLC